MQTLSNVFHGTGRIFDPYPAFLCAKSGENAFSIATPAHALLQQCKPPD